MDLFIPPGGRTKAWYVRVYIYGTDGSMLVDTSH